MSRTLIAGVGNVFFGDDGFGCVVARRLATEPLPDGVAVVEFGIRAVHLAFELSGGGWDRAIIVDAVQKGGAAGTLYVIDPERGDDGSVDDGSVIAGGHGLDLAAVLAMTRTLGPPPACVQVVGCEVAELGEHIGLSDAVERAVAPAVLLLQNMLERGAAPSRRVEHGTQA